MAQTVDESAFVLFSLRFIPSKYTSRLNSPAASGTLRTTRNSLVIYGYGGGAIYHAVLRIQSRSHRTAKQRPHRFVVGRDNRRHRIVCQALQLVAGVEQIGQIAAPSDAHRQRFVLEQDAIRVGGRTLLAGRVEVLGAGIVLRRKYNLTYWL